MNKFVSGIVRSKATLASLLVVAGAVAMVNMVQAWGPNRRTFTIENPADYITFNSITNSPYGDERNFVTIKEASQSAAAYTNQIKLVPGKEYDVRIFFHNNAKERLNLVAEGTKIKAFMAGQVKAGQKISLSAEVSATNASPNKVHDEVYVSTDHDVALRYVPGSARLITKSVNTPLGEDLFGNGALVGTYGRDGRVPGCNQFAGTVVYRFQVGQPNFTVKQEVRVKGTKQWFTEIKDVKPGETLEYRITYENVGTMIQSDVQIRSALPKGVAYIANTAQYKHAGTNGQYRKLNAEGEKNFAATKNVAFGAFKPKANMYVKFEAKLTSADQMNCNLNEYISIASAATNNGTKQARTKVTSTKACSKPTTPDKPKVTDPGALPKTGMNLDMLSSLIGLTGLVGSVGYYLNSRKQ